MIEPAFTITVYDATVGAGAIDEAVAVYREVYADPPYLEAEDDFVSFADDVPKRAEQESFRLVIARLGAQPLGFALGHQLPARTGWWQGVLHPLSPDLTVEYPGRTFAVIELAVRGPHRRRGLGRQLHTHLVADLSEERRTLLVRPEALAAKNAYANWGYSKIGQLKPFPGAPIYDVLIAQRIQR